MGLMAYLTSPELKLFYSILLGYGGMYLLALALAWIFYTTTYQHRRWTVEKMVYTAYALALLVHGIGAVYYAYVQTATFLKAEKWDFLIYGIPYWTIVLLDFVVAVIIWRKSQFSRFTSLKSGSSTSPSLSSIAT